LKANHNGQPLFAKKSPVSPHYVVATDNSLNASKKCSFEGGKNQYKPQGGRPAHVFRMPTNAELCDILNVKMTHSDPLEQTDLASARKTRMGLHRELIKRRPGQYPRGWLARRLGVTIRTLAAYNRIIPIHSRMMFTETPINWKTIECLPFDEPIQGAILVNSLGKRYPALRTIASRLLANGESLSLKQQTASYYWYGDEEPPIPEPIRVIEKWPQQEAIKAALAHQNTIFLPPEPFWRDTSQPPPPISMQSRAAKLPPHNLYKPLNDKGQEALAQHVYTTINQMGGEGRKSISLANARRIALMQSESRVRAALHLVQQRKTVLNPTGFITTILRSKYA